MSTPELPPDVAALATGDEPVVVVGQEGAVVAISPGAEVLLGVGADDVVGEFVEVLVPDGLRWGHQAYRRGFLAAPSERAMDPGLHPRAQRPDGTLVPIAVRLEPRRVDGALYVAAHLSPRAEESAGASAGGTGASAGE